MNAFQSGREKRLKDFELRKSDDSENVYCVEGTDWEYIPVHPLADDTIVLSQLNMTPEDCLAADCYWKFGADVALLQVMCRKAVPKRDIGFYARLSPGSSYLLNLVAVVDENSIRHIDVLRAMQGFFLKGLRSDGAVNWKIDNRLRPV